MATLVEQTVFVNAYKDISFEQFDAELQKVLEPFMDFINQYPNVFRLNQEEKGYTLYIQMDYLNINKNKLP